MVAKSNAVFLGYEYYEKVNNDGIYVEKCYFQFLVYDVESTCGITHARVLGVACKVGTDKYNDFMNTIPEVLGRCVLDLDIYIHPVTNVAQAPKIVRVCEV